MSAGTGNDSLWLLERQGPVTDSDSTPIQLNVRTTNPLLEQVQSLNGEHGVFDDGIQPPAKQGHADGSQHHKRGAYLFRQKIEA